MKKTKPNKNISSDSNEENENLNKIEFENLKWTTDEEREASINKLYRFAEQKAEEAKSWYLESKDSKSKWSRSLRFTAIILATLGGIAPVLLSIGALSIDTSETKQWVNSFAAIIGQLGYLFLALAASCIATDKFFGFSSGWMRYMKTAQILMKQLSEFRLDWTMMIANLGGKSPTNEQTQLIIQKLKEFISAVDSQVEQETLAWISEFQTSLSDIERTVKSQQEATKHGAIDVTVTNGMETEKGFTVTLDGMNVSTIKGTKHQIGYVSPGPHKILIRGIIKGEELEASEIVNVPAGEIAKVTIALPVKEAQP
ncbi:SLATT domain-containing protein [uncultured Cyclobacterium sp.]|uniref:SLATT domain-containing protein n=1 Tax=uncultured Cyclobacterium sp. TaxID=453820 RepID=UPI0030ED15D0|tara:strand:+ start:49474 stop:50412 length:939 start_codon:yes stop_codon:yes gene_type:complete